MIVSSPGVRRLNRAGFERQNAQRRARMAPEGQESFMIRPARCLGIDLPTQNAPNREEAPWRAGHVIGLGTARRM